MTRDIYIYASATGVGICLLLFFTASVFRKIKYHYKELRELGFFQESKKTFSDPKGVIREKTVKAKIKVYWKGNKLIFSKYNLSFSKKDFEARKENLEHLFSKKIEEISTEKPFLFWQQKRIILHTEAFKDVLPFSECPKLKVGQIWLGKDGLSRDVVIDTIKDFQSTLLIVSHKGSGKSVLIRTIVKSFFKSLKETGRLEEYQLIFIDAKMTDFLDLIEEYQAKTFNPVFSEELKECVDFLSENKTRVDEYRRYLQTEKISLRHWDEAKGLDISEPPKKLLIVIDEAKQFLAVRESLKITKDSSEDEKALKERYDLEKKLAFLINNIAEIQRPTGNILLISSQDSRATTYAFDFTNFKTMILGQQNQAQSHALTGSNIAEDKTLRNGKFIFVGDGEVKKIQAPLCLPEEKAVKSGR